MNTHDLVGVDMNIIVYFFNWPKPRKEKVTFLSVFMLKIQVKCKLYTAFVSNVVYRNLPDIVITKCGRCL